MGAVRMLAGHDIRRRRRSTVAVALLVGAVGAVVLATAAGARRSDTALSRFDAESRLANVEIYIGLPSTAKLAAFRKTPGIAAMARLRGYAFGQEGLESLAILAPLDSVFGDQVDRARVIDGRAPDPSAREEITIGETLSERLHLSVGDYFELPSYTGEQIKRAFAGGDREDPAGPTVRLQVVGVVRRPLDLGVRASSGGVVSLTPAFARKYEGRIGAYTDMLRVRTERGPADVARLVAVAQRMFGSAPTFGTQALSTETEGARNAIDVLTLALWIIAGVTALAGFVAIGIVLTRDVANTDLDHTNLRALGLTRAELVAASGPRALLIACGGAIIAGLGAVCLSPLLPIGVARRADPNAGFHVDWTVLGLAIPVLIVLVLGIAILSVLRATRAPSFERGHRAYRRTSTIVDRATGIGLRPTATNGLRMAIQSGTDESAVPVRSAFVGAVLGVAGVTAALVFGASLNHLVETPRLYGWTFDIKSDVPTNRVCGDKRDYGLSRQRDVEAVAVVCATGISLDGRPVTAWGFESLHGTIDPEIVSGRAPRGPGEIALGAVTLRALHKHIGDTVRARGEHARELRIVGRVVLPTIGEPQPLADGAALTGAGFRPMYDEGANETHTLVARLAPGADRAALVRRLEAKTKPFGDQGKPRPVFDHLGGPTVPVEVSRLQQIDRIPAVVAALLGVLALLAVGHALVTSVRRRRRELALLKVLGFDRHQVRATVAWQATTLGAVGLLIGLPAGFVAGRMVWHLVAEGLGVSTLVATPGLALILTAVGALVLVNLISYFPARTAAQTRPAVALRSE